MLNIYSSVCIFVTKEREITQILVSQTGFIPNWSETKGYYEPSTMKKCHMLTLVSGFA